MIEVVGNLWKYPADVRVITTNGTITRAGECVMGRGCALEAKKMYPDLPKRLAAAIKTGGNNPHVFADLNLMSFPVKHHWFERADLLLIRSSALQLARIAKDGRTYVLPRPGCGNGKREWAEVAPLLKCLPDNVHVITYPTKVGEREA